MIVFGVDPLAALVADALVSGTAGVPPRLSAMAVGVASANPVTDLRRCVADSMEAARSRGEVFEPRLGCLVTAFASDAVKSLEMLRASCEMLQTVAAGNQTVALVVLVPPVNADDIAKAASFRFFRVLESLVGELPFLDLVFVNQVGYEASQSTEAKPGEELETLLVRELLDPDLRQLVASLGHTAVNWRTRVSGRKACYSTLGRYRLEYRPDDALAHISGRLQRELLEAGLLSPKLLEKEARVAIQARVDEITSRHLAAILERLPPTPTVDPDALAGACDSDSLGNLLSTLAVDADSAVDKLTPEFHRLFDLLEGWTRRELLDFLPANPAYLAGARAFLNALLGQRLSGDAGRASGVGWLWQELCRQPLDQSIVPAGKILLLSLGLGSAVPQEWPKEVTLEWLAKTVAVAGDGAGPQESPVGTPARLLARLLERIAAWLAESDAQTTPDGSIVNKIAELYLSEVVPLLGRMAANRAESGDIERALDILPSRYGLIRRLLTQRVRFQAELAKLAGRRAELSGEHELLQRVLAQGRSLFGDLLNEILLPQLLRRGIGARLRRDAEQASAELITFVDALVKGVEACQVRGALAEDEQRTTTHARLLNSQRLDALYLRTIEHGKIVFPKAVDELLAFLPRTGDPAAPRLSYRDCRALRDHYLRGAQSLLDRMADYTREQSAWLLSLDALDVIECEGREPASRFLADVRERSRRFLDLSPGMLPLVEAQGHPRLVFVVRTAVPLARRLAAGYGGLFVPGLSFVDANDRCVIEIMSVTVGFPAFLIHVLHEGRRLALAEDAEAPEDLWPC